MEKIFFANGCLIGPAPFVEKTVPYLMNSLFIAFVNHLDIFVGLFLHLFSVPLIHISVLFPKAHCLDCSSFVESLEIRKCDSLNLTVFFQHCFGYSSSFALPYTFYILESSCSLLPKCPAEILIGTAKLVDQLVELTC